MSAAWILSWVFQPTHELNCCVDGTDFGLSFSLFGGSEEVIEGRRNLFVVWMLGTKIRSSLARQIGGLVSNLTPVPTLLVTSGGLMN